MSENYLAHDFDWNTGSRCISGRMPPEIVRPQFDAGELSCLLDDNPGSRIRDRKNPLLRLKRSLLDVSTQTLHHLSRNEDNLSVLAALWTLDRQLMVAYIFRGELQDFADPHASPGHQFQDKSVSQLRCPEDDFVDRLLFDNLPVDGFAWPVDFPQHRSIARVLNGRIEIGLDEIEEGLEVGVTTVLGLLLSALRDHVQKGENLLGCDGGKIAVIAKVVAKFGQRSAVGLNRIFSLNSSCGTLDKLGLPGRVSWLASCLGCEWVQTDGDYKRNVRYPFQLCKNPNWLRSSRIWQDVSIC